MYARRAAVLCNGECTPRDGLAPVRKRKGRRVSCLPRPPDAFGALCSSRLPRRASLRGKAADQAGVRGAARLRASHCAPRTHTPPHLVTAHSTLYAPYYDTSVAIAFRFRVRRRNRQSKRNVRRPRCGTFAALPRWRSSHGAPSREERAQRQEVVERVVDQRAHLVSPGLRARARARLGRAHLSPAHLGGVRRQRRLEAPGRLVRVRDR